MFAQPELTPNIMACYYTAPVIIPSDGGYNKQKIPSASYIFLSDHNPCKNGPLCPHPHQGHYDTKTTLSGLHTTSKCLFS